MLRFCHYGWIRTNAKIEDVSSMILFLNHVFCSIHCPQKKYSTIYLKSLNPCRLVADEISNIWGTQHNKGNNPTCWVHSLFWILQLRIHYGWSKELHMLLWSLSTKLFFSSHVCIWWLQCESDMNFSSLATKRQQQNVKW